MNESCCRDLVGLKAVVTGAASGIGRTIAAELARAGAAVLLHTRRNRHGIDELAAQIRREGGEAEIALADLIEPAEQDQLVEAAWKWQPRIDILVNNAGADVLTGPAGHWTFEQKLEYLWRVDVVAAMRLSRRAGKKMQESGCGAILNMGWDGADRGMAGDSGELFAAVKGAVMAFTRSLAHSLAPTVRVNCLAPGWIKTAWGETAGPYWQERAESESLLARWGTPEDVARAAHFLVSPASSFINGQVLPVNGGYNHS